MRIRFLTEDNKIKTTVESTIHEYENSNQLSVFTSGSTGLPKNITHSKSAVEFSAKNTINYFNWNKSTKSLLCLSANTIGGKMMIIRSLIADSELIVGEVTKNPLLSLEETIDFIAVVPYQLEAMLDESMDKLKSISIILVGGGAISTDLESRLIAEKITIYHSFGMSETISHVAIKKVGHEGSKYYEVLPDIEISTSEDQLLISSKGLNLVKLKTNDIVSIIDNNHFEWIGRKDFVINSGGVKIHPEIVEEKIKQLIQSDYYITALNHDKLGEQVVLVLLKNQFLPSKIELQEVLPKFEVPKMIIVLDEFVWTESGKINRIKTNELLINGTRTIL